MSVVEVKEQTLRRPRELANQASFCDMGLWSAGTTRVTARHDLIL